ncbi:hypothetical protein [Niabella hibiscisoli]|uniref:hypothetical protein n=1 Tax=Niabella hibiscisoli TaxID=1825928 RepID=UPI001F10EF84|nr:hypothetical protein [Niabella hibiscisoli]MCH5719581.1 hypothetical protein [Niabella hibiscisoli]
MANTNTQATEVLSEQVTPLTLVINEAVDKGFDLIFRIKENGSLWDQYGINYEPGDMKIVFSRVFENNPEDARQTSASRVYLLRNNEGDKGILVDADGIYGDGRIAACVGTMEYKENKRMERQGGLKNKLTIAAAGLLLIGSAIAFRMLGRRS